MPTLRRSVALAAQDSEVHAPHRVAHVVPVDLHVVGLHCHCFVNPYAFNHWTALRNFFCLIKVGCLNY